MSHPANTCCCWWPGSTRSHGISCHVTAQCWSSYPGIFGFSSRIINTLRPRQNGRHFPDNIFKCIFWNENVWILIKISLKFVFKGPVSYIPSLVQIMAWRPPGDKPFSEPMMVRLQMHICITRPQWVNISKKFLPVGSLSAVFLLLLL